ncbi:succinyldiaminopimelate transaminase [Pseudoclavibacter sp. AY1H1]|uniref:succinyldiaminopimelate transaminase n=1 Tax=Pseudoclavibacter sp. AY1H1 TaxID=2080584 RepID=UPI000CE79A97|nr:succinyldiaminopimelate transaminase [Pseudoclavibacter sp. AY1H1]PPF39733.1 succinyldiaminopimelate transaminase [Pseudoclavibacter sp. AY1H1]
MTLGELPDYPWDQLKPYIDQANAHPDGALDLSIGSPVDPTPEVVRAALRQHADAHSYPTTIGTPEARDAVVAWFARCRGVSGLLRSNTMLTVGSKEFVATTAFFLRLGEGDTVVYPARAYPTYEIGAVFAGAQGFAGDDPAAWPESTKLIWLNSPGNPDGRVLGVEELAAAVARARELGAVIVNDECYAELGWGDWSGERIPSILDERVTGGDLSNILACSSLSKRSNLAGYRAAYVAGDAQLISRLLTARKHAGLIVPAPVQAAVVAALGDDEHAVEQYNRYLRRREVLLPALQAWGLRIEHSEAGLYLWGTKGDDSWATIEELAELGIIAGPGVFYGEAGGRHVRVSLTATDAHVDEAARRLIAASPDHSAQAQ